MTARTCRECGRPIGARAVICGSCMKRMTAAARAGRHVYSRVHVHVWPDGHRTIELGVRCEGSHQ